MPDTDKRTSFQKRVAKISPDTISYKPPPPKKKGHNVYELAIKCSKKGCRAVALRMSLDVADKPFCRSHMPDKYQEYYDRYYGKHKQSRGGRRLEMPKSVVEFYEDALVDDSLVALKEDLATIEARIRQVLRQIKEAPHETTPFLQLLRKNILANKKAVSKGSTRPNRGFQNILELVDEKLPEGLLWQEYLTLTAEKRRLVLAETKRYNDLGWTPEQGMAMISEIIDILKGILEPEQLSAFMDVMAKSAMFQEKSFSLVPTEDATRKALEDQLNDIERKRALRMDVGRDGVYEVVEDGTENS